MAAFLEALHFDLWTFIFQTINILIVVAVLYLLLWKPVGKIINSRGEKIEGALREASSAKERAEEMLASYQQQLTEAQQEARNILKRATETAEAARSEMVNQAKEDAAQVLDKARLEIEKEKTSAIAAIRSQTADLVVLATGKVLARSLTSEEQEHLLANALTEVERLQ